MKPTQRYKALAVSAGLTFWFFVITSTLGIFSLDYFVVFIVIIFPLMQLLAFKVSRVLDMFALFNTKIFLGLFFITIISLYGILLRVLQVDLIRLKKKDNTYWLSTEQLKEPRIFKQY